MASASRNKAKTRAQASSPLTKEDQAILQNVPAAISQGRDLLRWWRRIDETRSYSNRFPIDRQIHQPDTNFGFLENAPLEDGILPVLGVIQDQLYDYPKAPPNQQQANTEWVRRQVKAFMLYHFMPTSTTLAPWPLPQGPQTPPPPYLKDFSLCGARKAAKNRGWGYEQWYYKLRESGEIGKFPEEERFSIVSLPEIGAKYDWIVLRVQLFNTDFDLHPFGEKGPTLSENIIEKVHTVLTPDFIVHEENQRPGVAGEYGYGYSVVPDPSIETLFGYGPNQLRHTIETITLRVLESGEVRAHMNFIAPQITRFLKFEPVQWGFRLADALSLGTASRWMAPLKQVLLGLQPEIDPLRLGVRLANLMTAGLAEEEFCISWERLTKNVMSMHYQEAQDFFNQSSSNFRLVADWTDEKSLPEWAAGGIPN